MREHGWINFFIEFSFLKIEIHLSSIFDPIPGLLEFTKQIYEGTKGTSIEIDEEGVSKIIDFFKQDDDDVDVYVLKITSTTYGQYAEYEVLKTISRRVFLSELT